MKLLPTVLSCLLFCIVIAIPPALLTYTGNTHWLAPKFWAMFIFISGLTFLTVIAIIIVGQIRKELYAQTFLAATTVKLLAGMSFALVFIMKIKVNPHVFIADFIYLYFLNMGFEIYCLLRNLRNQNSQ